MSDVWYKKLGFYINPFSIKPSAFRSEVVAYDLSYIYEKIKNDEVLFIEGEYGTGKTTILKNIIDEFRGKNKIIYYSFNDSREFDIKGLVNGANTTWGKLVGKEVRNMILLLDEVHLMKQVSAEKLLDYYKRGIFKSIVFVTHDYDQVDFPDEFSGYLSGNIIKTVSLTLREIEELIHSRLGNIDLFSRKAIKKIFNLSGKNPRRFLEFCEDIAKFAVDMGDYEITDFHIEEVLENVIEEQKKRKRRAKKEPMNLEDIEVKSVDLDNPETQERLPKFKVNNLVGNTNEKYGIVSGSKASAEDEEESVYNVYYID